ncbi:DUF1428 domain-containing protein [Pseudobacteriovorax antillogorgiicola]|uniref:Uncharacterized conserved protein YbaA, DUF1428 family n=1 Tax=Pseudobacteriovorax antillogorgiicola TaxID=1513793 RepID=A0A1Y6BTY1_9BACT|nr:DUF1428 domain-containing protein [Pseudobacteriovorax antillogorgiicola]TCS52440.1 uncharacterized protein YbaA (DUF1428 family) [Pseudobacteriovorax antillogorgiicola]SMF28635.1 Uncharacterized conserved protein YbaA, DUF1428 family [Pseudobacteriovorax antillogorgiicola]
MKYVDGFLAAVPKENRDKFIEHSKACTEVLMNCGALSVVDCWGDDVPDGKVTSMPLAVQKKDDEVIVFSWITWPSKAIRDEGMKKFVEDPAMTPENNPMPFDGKRLIYGGFEVVHSHGD